MPAVSKDAGKKSCDVRSKENENNEENETWKRKQQEVPRAMVMMYTDNFQDWLGLKYRIQIN